MASSHSLVLELQRLATDKSNDIADLLRKAMLVATKLKINDFRKWIDSELNGYSLGAKVPVYRTARGELRAKNPYHGLIPYFIEDPRVADAILNVELREGIGSYVHLLEGHDGGLLCVQLSPSELSYLLRGQDVPLEPVRLIGRNKLAAVIDTVRTTILDWALRLESEGILGEGMTFSEDEKQRAAASTEIHIGNFQGVLGDIADSIVTQNLQMSVKRGDFGSLRGYLTSQGVEAEDIAQLKQALDTDPRPTHRSSFGPCVSDWLGKMMARAASGASQLAIGTAGSLLAQAIWVYYGL